MQPIANVVFSDDGALSTCPCSELAAQRPTVEVLATLLFRDLLDLSDDPDGAVDLAPVKGESGVRVGEELLGLSGGVVCEKDEAVGIELLEEDHAYGRDGVGGGGCERDGFWF